LEQSCATDPRLDDLADELGAAIDPDGTLVDHASADLKRLRIETANLRSRLVRRLEEMVQKKAELLSDSFYTIREGRYVLPVRTDAHEKIHGIVHGTSQSGATVFVEPRALIGQSNRLKMAQGEMEREEARILGLLTDQVREQLPAARAAVDALDQADLRNASARFGRDTGGHLLHLHAEARIHLRRARHPLLLLDGVDVVPNDVELASGQGLVLSGPNAGGKTVALKILGLAALMARAGLPVPADEGSECGFFSQILTDVGDEQSLEKNLSTFSAHVTNLSSILGCAGPRTLVLLDELAGGTDPEEGAALACAVLEALCDCGAAVGTTTHYEPLKALALRDDRFRNASVGFDVGRLEPTFELSMDVPGVSSALAVAARFGIPDSVVSAARSVLPEQSRTFDELVRRLEEQRQALEAARSDVEEERRSLGQERDRLAQELSSMRTSEAKTLSREGERLLAAVGQAREDVRAVRKRLREREVDDAEIHRLGTAVDSAHTLAQSAKEQARPEPAADGEGAVDASQLTVGSTVYIPRLRSHAKVVAPAQKGKVRVAAGPMKMTVEISELRMPEEREPGPQSKASAEMPSAESRSQVRTTANTLDLRGLRVDEALGMMESFVDRLYGASEPVAYIVHGLGTGALRNAVRESLARDATYVQHVRPGLREEGGDGVTVVELR